MLWIRVFDRTITFDDTIIIVLAQSGTTIDTNVYARLAKERGAYIIFFVAGKHAKK